ncbi:murein hydrolase activator EnvC family protein [Microbacterium sp. NPDC058342]|uniref:murein hydrolase activator EnvC family protein n=1 Tax=Microbacterium sp. NPDC058342 TaxID=3346454 RepID=UPI0036528A97
MDAGMMGPRTRLRRIVAALMLGAVLIAGTGALSAAAVDGRAGEAPVDSPWRWPADGPREVLVPFRAPAHEYGPGHRGMDVDAGSGVPVLAPAAGIVAFRGVVVDRPLITIDHGGGYVTTLEPVASELTPGDAVAAGERVGIVASGGHAMGSLHVGVRIDGRYVNPLGLFGLVPRAVLLPCCRP